MDPYGKDLQRWMPRLLSVWRRARRRPGPPDRLEPRELQELGAAVRQLSLGLTRDRALSALTDARRALGHDTDKLRRLDELVKELKLEG